MGSFDGAETSDLIGLFLLSKVKHLNVDLGCFRVDWLGFSRLTARQKENVKKKIQKIFEDHDLRINITVDKNIADYLHITLDMKNGTYMPYTNQTIHQLMFMSSQTIFQQ